MFKNKKGFIIKLQRSRTFKGFSVFLALNIFFQIVQPTAALALTEGPSQPEVQSFEPIGTTQMVDMFTGDFNYNIPLFNLPGPNGGYPVNLAYHAGNTVDDEASTTGYGWNINVGSLVRSVRGLPDEFKSLDDDEDGNSENIDHDGIASAGRDYLEVQSDMKQSWTLGLHASFSPELFGAELAVAQENTEVGNFNIGASIYYNNYNGVGMSIEPSWSMGGSSSPLNLGLSLDSENGLGMNASLSYGRKFGNYKASGSLGLNFDGNLSIESSMSLKSKISTRASGGASLSCARNNYTPSVTSNIDKYNFAFSVKFGIEAPGYFNSGSVGLFYNTEDYSKADKEGVRKMVVGYAQSGSETSQNHQDEFTRDFIRQSDGQITNSSMYLPNSIYAYDFYNSSGQGLSGYFRAHRSDIGRSYDPHVTNTSIGANGSLEVGAGTGAKIGFSVGVNFGWDSQGAWNNENSLAYEFMNPDGEVDAYGNQGYKENVYYQFHGEQTILDDNELTYMNGLNLPFVRLTEKAGDGLEGGKRKIGNDYTYSKPNNEYSNERSSSKRKVRNTLVHNLKNKEVGKLGEFNVNYFTTKEQIFGSTPRPQTTLDRNSRRDVNIKDHPAGYKVLNDEGSYYVYGLPAYNNKEIDNLHSAKNPYGDQSSSDLESISNDQSSDYKVDGTHKFINKTTKTPYAHSYLLTSVQGADYVDVDNDGPSDSDLGYWVKFNYLQHSTDFAWRSPYTENQYNQGKSWTAEDDKVSYQYGEKEIWYTAQIETKSHIAIFKMKDRNDFKEAYGENADAQVSGSTVEGGLLIDEIHVYEKKSFLAHPTTAKALQVIHFQYEEPSNQLCQGTPNSSNGKATLKALWFTSNGSTRGELNKYVFDYSSQSQLEPSDFDNPNFAKNSYDSWSCYKPKGSSYEHHSNFPYVNQFNQEWGSSSGAWSPSYNSSVEDRDSKKVTKKAQDDLVSAWSLKKITLPSGGEINIKYESDDYGYVQHKAANQMFKITKLGDESAANEVYNTTDETNDLSNVYYKTGNNVDETRRRIYFKLEIPLANNDGSNDITIRNTVEQANSKVYNKYVLPIIQDEHGQRNLYFKTKMKMVDDIYDYVSGYLPMEENLNEGSFYNFGVSTVASTIKSVDGVMCYTQGYVTVKATKKKNGSYFDKYHPLALAGFTYLQTDAQMLLHNSGGYSDMGSDPSSNDAINQMALLASAIPSTASSFGMIRRYCHSKNMARYIDLEKSVIRLASPDKVKFGGGHRVKEISIKDNWHSDVSSEVSREYGQAYDYTIVENGEIISSGVAQYEPQIGGDENALKYPVYYFDKQNTHTNNNLFAEAPFNESLFPGASVGYRKVTVRSLNTKNQMDRKDAETTVNIDDDPANDLPATKGRTAGVTVHQFYTAKEFPTIVEASLLSEENGTKDVFKLPIMIPFIGTLSRRYYHGTQAYMIELNDMHGKLKSVESFELNNYKLNPNPITSSYQEYQSEPYKYGFDYVLKLNNNVDIIANDGTHAIQTSKKLMGVEVDMFTDQRQNKTFSNNGSFAGNIDIPVYTPPLPFPTFWITYSNSKTMYRTYVTNKVIHKTGILKKTISRDIQTKSETEILAYDEKSGVPLLSRIKNEFGDDFYSYNIPAYYVYDRMGHAYNNINYNFFTNFSSVSDSKHKTVKFDVTAEQIDYLVRGDELLIYTPSANGVGADIYKKGYFIGFDYSENGTTPTKGILHFDQTLSNEDATNVRLKVVRSGYRNHYNSIAANYVTKGKLTDIPLVNAPLTSAQDATPIETKLIATNVLSATASLFKDDWLTTDISQNTDLAVIDNPFLTGNSGIFRPYKAYTYVGERKQRADFVKRNTNIPTNTNPELFNDGVMENVPMFSWDIGNLEDYSSNWEWINEVTKYSNDSYEVENINRLNINTSSLLGYNNALTIGIGGNASYFELGVVDFETSQNNGDATQWKFGESIKQTNLNFYNTLLNNDGTNPVQKFISTEHYKIKNAKFGSDGLINIVTNIPYAYYTSVYNDLEPNYGITLNSTKNIVSKGNRGFYFNAFCQSQVPTKMVTGGTIPDPNERKGCAYPVTKEGLPYNNVGVAYTAIKLKPHFATPTNVFNLLATNSEFTGKISLLLNKQASFSNSVTTSSTQFVSNKAHTGQKSMKINSMVRFDQFKLKLIKNKKYIVSMWVSRDNTNVPSYLSSTFNPLSLGTFSGSSFTAISNAKYSYGKIIEGWQKIDVEFSVGEDEQVLSMQFTNGSSPIYVDDVRFSPKTGGITTYVYDANKYWLKASLNMDNYATLFFYDAEGKVTLKKQETEKGIFTITESRGHVSEGN